MSGSAYDVLADAGITERQVGYWIRQGYLNPVRHGQRRDWTTGELRVALLMGRLTEAGFTPAAAADAARQAETLRTIYRLADGNPVSVDLGGGLVLTVLPAAKERAA